MSDATGELRWWPIHAAGITALVGILIGGYALGVYPRKALAGREADRREAILSAERRMLELEDVCRVLGQRLEESKVALGSAGIQLFPPERRLERVAAIAAAAEQSGLSLRVVSPGAVKQAKRSEELEITLGADCTGEGLRTFLGRLAGEFPDVRVDELGASASNAGTDRGLSIQMILVWQAARPATSTASLTPER